MGLGMGSEGGGLGREVGLFCTAPLKDMDCESEYFVQVVLMHNCVLYILCKLQCFIATW